MDQLLNNPMLQQMLNDPRAEQMKKMMAIMSGLGQTPQMSDPPVMSATNPMASMPQNPMGFAGPGNPMQNNPMLWRR